MRVLVVEDDHLPRVMMGEWLRADGFDVVEAVDVPSARRLLPECDVAVIDMVLPGESGLVLLAEAVRADRAALMVTAGTSAAEQVEAMKRGAYDVLRKPLAPAPLVHAVSRAVERTRLARENARLVARLEGRAHDLEQERAALVGELEQRAELLAISKLEWEDTFDAIAQPIAVLDEALRVVRSNRAVEGAARAPADAILGRPCHEALFGAPDRCAGCPVIAGGAGERHAELSRAGRVVRVSAFPVTLGRGTHVVIHEDVTEQRRLSERLARAERLAAVARLAAGVAHEVNNPLASVVANLRSIRGGLGYIRDVLAASRAPALEVELADAIVAVSQSAAAADRVAEIVAALRLIAGDASGDLVPVDVGESLERAAGRARRAAGADEGVAVSWDLGARGRPLADPARLDHACFELLKNAFQASPPGGTVRVRTLDAPDAVRVEIADEGAGIPPAFAPRLGEAFFTSRDVGAGRGLGLAVASGILRQMGGGLAVRALDGRGTSAVFTLAAATEPERGPAGG